MKCKFEPNDEMKVKMDDANNYIQIGELLIYPSLLVVSRENNGNITYYDLNDKTTNDIAGWFIHYLCTYNLYTTPRLMKTINDLLWCQSKIHIFRYFKYYVLMVDGNIIYVANKSINDISYTYPNVSNFSDILVELMNIDQVKFTRMMDKRHDN